MHLKRLELQGFKSFAGKTVFDFPAGVVAIVGPNGSGKSNVIDAIRWLLGEREAKNLRGSTVSDLIFSGTNAASRVGAAQATIRFDNSTGFFPVEFAEVAVTRKIFRDGTSQYFLNNAEVRLKDILDFFSGSRLGTRGLTIINQGNSDLFVRATPAERREMVEEILGLKQFQNKRHDANLKLKNMRANLEKVQAMVDELLPRLRLLRRQATKWAEHANIEKELRELEDKYFSFKLAELHENEGAILPTLKSLSTDIDHKIAELRELQRQLNLISETKPAEHVVAQAGRRRAQEIMARRATIERELGRLEAKLEFAATQGKSTANEAQLIAGLKDARAALKSALSGTDLVSFKKAVQSIVEKIDELFGGKKPDVSGIKSEIEKSRTALAVELETLSVESKEIERANMEAAKGLEDFNKVFRKAFEAVEYKKDELARLESQKSKLQFDHERVAMRREDLRRELQQIGRRMEEFEKLPVAEAASDFMETAERRMFKLRGDLAAIGAIDEALLKEAKEAEERYIFLSEQIDDLVKSTRDLQSLIKKFGEKIKHDFAAALSGLNEHFNNYFRLMFGGGKAKLLAVKPEPVKIMQAEEGGDEVVQVAVPEEDEAIKDDIVGLDIDINLPKKGVKSLDTLSGGEKSLVSIAALFALTTISPPPFLVLDEVDAALDEANTRRFADLIKEFSKTTQFVVVTHNRATMEAADILYGVTLGADGVSKVLSVKLA